MAGRIAAALAPWIVIPVVGWLIYAIWWLGALASNGSHHRVTQIAWEQFIQRDLFPNGWTLTNNTSLFYLIVIVFAILSVICALGVSDGEGDAFDVVVVALVIVTVLGGGYRFVTGIADNAKDEGRSYAASTVYVIPPDTRPESLRWLLDGAKKANSPKCTFVGRHDVPSCIVEGNPPSNWKPRTTSFASAYKILSQSASGAASKTTLLESSTTHLYNPSGDRWSGIRDGNGRQPLYSVVEWNGSDTATDCKFEGDYALNRAFGGEYGTNLSDLIAKRYPDLFFKDGNDSANDGFGTDLWGYCKDTGKKASNGSPVREPIVVLPATEQHGFGNRTTLRAAGVIIIQGDHGKVKMTHLTTVRSGQFPGPVYPMSLVAKQRDMTQWSAGERNRSKRDFGYEPSYSTVLEGNNSEFLRETPDGRLYWVTPLVPRSSDSDVFVASSCQAPIFCNTLSALIV